MMLTTNDDHFLVRFQLIFIYSNTVVHCTYNEIKYYSLVTFYQDLATFSTSCAGGCSTTGVQNHA